MTGANAGLLCRALTLAAAAAAAVSGLDLTYANYARLLQRYACPEGVAYSTLAGEPLIGAVRSEFAAVTRRQLAAVSREDQIAFLLNAYNFHAIALVERHYPLRSGIRDIAKAPLDTAFIPLLGDTVSLNGILNDMLRKGYHEPRIHFALNCAAKGSPALRSAPYTGAHLGEQLDSAALAFLSDTSRARVEGARLLLSETLDRCAGDFKETYGSCAAYVTRVLGLTGSYKVKPLPFDWSLNEAPPCRKVRDE